MIQVKPKKCKGTGRAIGYGCSDPFLFASMGKFHWWIKQKASDGYFMFPGEFDRVVFV